MRCIICDQSEWQNVDEFRIKKEGMAICKNCGFVSYPDKWQSKEEIIKFYRKDYRRAPNASAYFTGEKKIHFHLAFLAPLFDQWKKDKKDPVIGEVGSAYGIFLQWIKSNFPKADLSGVELTETFKRNAFHEYGFKFQDDLDYSKQYDMIATYKVLEHQLDADKELTNYGGSIKEDGFVYAGVPIWFQEMANFGEPGFDLDNYYHPNHINVWSREHFQYMINKAGLEIVRQNFTYYDDVYLLRRQKEKKQMETPKLFDQTMSNLKKIKNAFELFQEGKYQESLQTWPNYPTAWSHYYEVNRAKFDAQGFESIKGFIDKALNSCPGSATVNCLAADIHMRYDRFEQAIKYLETALTCRPEYAPALIQLGHCYRNLGYKALEPDKRTELFKNSREVMRHLRSVSTEHFKECTDWIYQDNANIPIS